MMTDICSNKTCDDKLTCHSHDEIHTVFGHHHALVNGFREKSS